MPVSNTKSKANGFLLNNYARRQTRSIAVGPVKIGGGSPVSVQSMTNTDTCDFTATLDQINELYRCGCDIVRIALPELTAINALKVILDQSPLPIIGDVHFDYRIAVAAANAGIHGLRINPGNVGGVDKIREITAAAKANGVSLRVGVNGGSLQKDLLARHGGATPEALVESALRSCELIENQGAHHIKVSLKASDVPTTVKACRLFAACTDYPIHLGVTEAGTCRAAAVKSAVGIGTLLMEGIGDTLRVSITGPPAEEVRVGIQILEAAGLRDPCPEIIACPTCGRTKINLLSIVNEVEDEIERLKKAGFKIGLKRIAVMGCVVNGPGEARTADIGIAGGKGKGILFRMGETVRTLPENVLLPALLQEIRSSAVLHVPHEDNTP